MGGRLTSLPVAFFFVRSYGLILLTRQRQLNRGTIKHVKRSVGAGCPETGKPGVAELADALDSKSSGT